jgi:heme-degrading monooxygenase HmoA
MATFRRVVPVAPAPPPGPVVAAATYLPLSRWRYLFAFNRMASRVAAQLESTPGVVWFSIQAEFGRRTFWTLSVWKDRESIHRFLPAEPHASAMRRFSVWGAPEARFADWDSPSVWVTWPEAYRHLGHSPRPGRIIAPPRRPPAAWSGAPSGWPD